MVKGTVQGLSPRESRSSWLYQQCHHTVLTLAESSIWDTPAHPQGHLDTVLSLTADRSDPQHKLYGGDPTRVAFMWTEILLQGP